MKKLIVILALSIGATAAMAQTAQQEGMGSQRMAQMMQTRFAAANTTHDGKLTKAQAQAGMPMVAKHFDEIDTQKVGYVTLEQIETFAQQHGGAH